MTDARISARVPDALAESLAAIADEQGVSRSEVIRTALREFAESAAEVPEHAQTEEARNQIIEEEMPNKRRAWFRSNVGGRLLKCFNGGLTPDEAELDLASYRRVADEVLDDPDRAAYVDEGLAVYAEAFDAGRGPILRDWIMQSTPDDVGAPSGDPGDVSADAAALAEALADEREGRTYGERVSDAVHLVEGGGWTVDELADRVDVDKLPDGVTIEDFREDVLAEMGDREGVSRSTTEGEGNGGDG